MSDFNNLEIHLPTGAVQQILGKLWIDGCKAHSAPASPRCTVSSQPPANARLARSRRSPPTGPPPSPARFPQWRWIKLWTSCTAKAAPQCRRGLAPIAQFFGNTAKANQHLDTETVRDAVHSLCITPRRPLFTWPAPACSRIAQAPAPQAAGLARGQTRHAPRTFTHSTGGWFCAQAVQTLYSDGRRPGTPRAARSSSYFAQNQ